ncbi:MAG: MerR family transcriptional regulator [Thermoanaerobaculia bacterium]|nr:MerR family transcriptional regulator [Thermoanaerobaculia bacterium]
MARKKKAAPRASAKTGAARPNRRAAQGGGRKLYTLSEVAAKTGISIATLQRYKKAHQDRLPAVGEGRSQRYPQEALAVFRQIRKENEARRGRGTKPAAKKGSAGRSGRSGRRGTREEPLLTLLQIGQMTGISYPTLLRYVRLHLDRIPHVGTGRRRRFHPQAVAVFQELRERSRRGRRGPSSRAVETPASIAQRLARLADGPRRLASQHKELERTLKRPNTLTLQR